MDKKLLILVAIFLLIFINFIYITLKRSPFSTVLRASEEINPSTEKSIILAWPLVVKKGENKPIQITVFIKNNKGIPLANKKVTLITSLGQIKENDILTDKNGKAQFILENNQSGVAVIEAIVNDNLKLINKVSVKFE